MRHYYSLCVLYVAMATSNLIHRREPIHRPRHVQDHCSRPRHDGQTKGERQRSSLLAGSAGAKLACVGHRVNARPGRHGQVGAREDTLLLGGALARAAVEELEAQHRRPELLGRRAVRRGRHARARPRPRGPSGVGHARLAPLQAQSQLPERRCSPVRSRPRRGGWRSGSRPNPRQVAHELDPWDGDEPAAARPACVPHDELAKDRRRHVDARADRVEEPERVASSLCEARLLDRADPHHLDTRALLVAAGGPRRPMHEEARPSDDVLGPPVPRVDATRPRRAERRFCGAVADVAEEDGAEAERAEPVEPGEGGEVERIRRP
mmetsp:Transcript_28653/g.91778  ORF Transcript_28653/g.91778 Transcript_28653/m.91778 type:complete len:322 (-) Transcript_28653:171-1136(-)